MKIKVLKFLVPEYQLIFLPSHSKWLQCGRNESTKTPSLGSCTAGRPLCVMKNASFTPTVSSLLSLCSCRFLTWCLLRWELRNLKYLDLLVSNPSRHAGWGSLVAPLTVTNWQWVNAPLHTSNLFLKQHLFFLPSPKLSVEPESEGGQRLTERNNFQPSKDFLHGDTWVILMDTSPKLSRVLGCLSVYQTFLGSLPLPHNHSY